MRITASTGRDFRPRGATLAKRMPDRALGAYFVIFPIAVATFLSLQALRAQGCDLEMRASAHAPASLPVR